MGSYHGQAHWHSAGLRELPRTTATRAHSGHSQRRTGQDGPSKRPAEHTAIDAPPVTQSPDALRTLADEDRRPSPSHGSSVRHSDTTAWLTCQCRDCWLQARVNRGAGTANTYGVTPRSKSRPLHGADRDLKREISNEAQSTSYAVSGHAPNTLAGNASASPAAWATSRQQTPGRRGLNIVYSARIGAVVTRHTMRSTARTRKRDASTTAGYKHLA